MSSVELMAPVGSFEALHAAINAGADSVYFGVQDMNMRARASINFTLDDLKKIVGICNEAQVKTYLTLNVVVYDHELARMREICDTAKTAGISAVIAGDVAVMQYAKSIGLPVHISTQANVSNIEAVKFYAHFAETIVLARELPLARIKNICDDIQKERITGPNGKLVEIELFAHGALCVAVSGKCYMSLATYNSSANRGACLQNCRRAYTVTDKETGDQLDIENEYVMSPKDLCTIGFLDKIIDAGVNVLKIEGRGRSPEYAHTVITTYREAIDAIAAGTYTKENIDRWTKELETVFNKGFWHGGYYLGKELGMWSGVYGSKATTEKVLLGKVINHYANKNIAEVLIETGKVAQGDKIIITGPTTGVVEVALQEIWVNDAKSGTAGKQDSITFSCPKVRKNDKFFVIRKKSSSA